MKKYKQGDRRRRFYFDELEYWKDGAWLSKIGLTELPPNARVLTRGDVERAYMKKRKDLATIDDRDNCNKFLNFLFGKGDEV